jgi:hypothetical protein
MPGIQRIVTRNVVLAAEGLCRLQGRVCRGGYAARSARVPAQHAAVQYCSNPQKTLLRIVAEALTERVAREGEAKCVVNYEGKGSWPSCLAKMRSGSVLCHHLLALGRQAGNCQP